MGSTETLFWPFQLISDTQEHVSVYGYEFNAQYLLKPLTWSILILCILYIKAQTLCCSDLQYNQSLLFIDRCDLYTPYSLMALTVTFCVKLSLLSKSFFFFFFKILVHYKITMCTEYSQFYF